MDAKINNVLNLCHDQAILNAVQCIIQNMIACEDASQQQLSYLQSMFVYICCFPSLSLSYLPLYYNSTLLWALRLLILVNDLCYLEVLASFGKIMNLNHSF